MVHVCDFRYLSGIKIGSKQLYYLPKFRFRYFRTVRVFVFHCHDSHCNTFRYSVLVKTLVYLNTSKSLADDISYLQIDTITKWSHSKPTVTGNISYAYSNTNVATYKYSGELTSHINFLNYVQNLNNGIALWSNSIVFTYSSNSLNEITVIALPNIEYDGFVSATPNSSTGHIAEWTIFINALHYDNPNVKPMNDHEKTLLFAHEIGHTYGLGHFGGYIENGQYIYPIMSQAYIVAKQLHQTTKPACQ